MGVRASAGVKHDPETPLRPPMGSMTVAPAVDMYAAGAGTVSDVPVSYRGGYAGYGAYEPLYTGNFPATPQGTPGMASPYHGTYGSGGNVGMGSNQYYWAPPYVQEQALAVPTAYYHPDSKQSPVASSAHQAQAKNPIMSSVQRTTGQTGTPTKSASHDPRSKSEHDEEEGAKSA